MKELALLIFKSLYSKEIEEAKAEMLYCIKTAIMWESHGSEKNASHYHGRITGLLSFIRIIDPDYDFNQEYEKEKANHDR